MHGINQVGKRWRGISIFVKLLFYRLFPNRPTAWDADRLAVYA